MMNTRFTITCTTIRRERSLLKGFGGACNRTTESRNVLCLGLSSSIPANPSLRNSRSRQEVISGVGARIVTRKYSDNPQHQNRIKATRVAAHSAPELNDCRTQPESENEAMRKARLQRLFNGFGQFEPPNPRQKLSQRVFRGKAWIGADAQTLSSDIGFRSSQSLRPPNAELGVPRNSRTQESLLYR